LAVKDADPEIPVPETPNVNVPSPTVILLEEADVIKPLELTVITGIAVEDPKVPVVLLTVFKVVILPEEVTSPDKLALVITFEAVPESDPTNVFAVIVPDAVIVFEFKIQKVDVPGEVTLPVIFPTNPNKEVVTPTILALPKTWSFDVGDEIPKPKFPEIKAPPEI